MVGHGAWGMGHAAWPVPHVALDIGHWALDMGPVMGHGALDIGHWALGTDPILGPIMGPMMGHCQCPMPHWTLGMGPGPAVRAGRLGRPAARPPRQPRRGPRRGRARAPQAAGRSRSWGPERAVRRGRTGGGHFPGPPFPGAVHEQKEASRERLYLGRYDDRIGRPRGAEGGGGFFFFFFFFSVFVFRFEIARPGGKVAVGGKGRGTITGD